MSTSPPDDPWGSGSGSSPPPPPSGGYPPPPPGYPPPPGGGYGYPPPPPGSYPGGGYPGGSYPGGPYPGGGYPGGGYPGGGYTPGPGAKGWTPYGQACGWWQRVGATIIDGLVLLIPNFIVDAIGGRTVGTLLSLVVSAAYVVIMLSQRGQTVGDMAVGIRVVDAQTGGAITTGKALGRWASELLLAVLLFVPLLVDFLWPLWDAQNQTLHDKMAGTFVIRTN